jgi:hypothetical protein
MKTVRPPGSAYLLIRQSQKFCIFLAVCYNLVLSEITPRGLFLANFCGSTEGSPSGRVYKMTWKDL